MATGSRRLTVLIKAFLDFLNWLLIAGIILIPIITVLLHVYSPEEANDAQIFVELTLGLNETQAIFAGSQANFSGVQVQGWANVSADGPMSSARYLFSILIELYLCMTLFGVTQLRKLLSSHISGDSFTNLNANRIRKLGYAVISFFIVTPIFQLLESTLVLQKLEIPANGIQLHPSFDISVTGLFVGFTLFILAELLCEAVLIREEQELTI